jgi:hypothetical protein
MVPCTINLGPIWFLYEFRSTNLDSWQLSQLRTMKIGGNMSATEYFVKYGATALLNDSDTKKKYTSRVAELYKEELANRVKEDEAKWALYLVLCIILTLTTTTKISKRNRR